MTDPQGQAAAAQQAQEAAAARRLEEHAPEIEKAVAAVAEEGLAAANSPEHIERRLARVSQYRDDEERVLEKVINTADFLDIRYLEAGAAASRAVGRVVMRDGSGKRVGYGTGSLVSPRLLLTNHHVLGVGDLAASSQIEFNYQDGIDGQPLPSRVFPLDPETLFLADEGLDLALVAVRATAEELAEFGFNPLIGALGKALVGESVTIVQHPHGEKKQIALRENRIVALQELFMNYEADTEPGSSGSPVFNDQWEVVALHHASVRAPKGFTSSPVVNEGVRISRVVAFIQANRPAGTGGELVDELSGRERVEVPLLSPAAAPVEPAPAPSAPAAPAPSAPPADVDEAIAIDTDYRNRAGYDPEFLGGGELRVPLPELGETLLPDAALNREAAGEPRHVLPYHHFSVVLNARRRLAFYTAVNVDGLNGRRLRRETDEWRLDPRVADDEQTGEDVYARNPLDRGHLVRRLDPTWGATYAEAKRANDDTFHFTNCTPQHEDFNQGETLWAGLEDYILDHAQNHRFRACVFTGPVFAADDDEYRGVRLPREYWKVAVMVKRSGELSATGYLLSQESLLEGLEVDAEFSYGAYRTYQVPVSTIESITGLDFGPLRDADPLGRAEAAAVAREVAGAEDLVV
ncbi:MAG TPA: DNA/RNA non-specific endonuclease [Solirubrobacteraceae bacterium]|nr:DNA/RNA non-specific endonuclease [Solirubrobacteraceae bacterium]